MNLDVTPIIYQRGAAGVPATSALLPDLRGRLTAIDWSITDQFGFESCTLTFTGPVEEFLAWADELGASLVMSGPDAQTCWEGQLTEVRATLGQEQHSRSLEGMANRVRVRYTAPNGTPSVYPTGGSGLSDTTSQARYGIKDGVTSLDSATTADATALASRVLDKTRFPTRRPTSQATTGELGEVTIELAFTGWYGTLDWVLLGNASTTNTAVSTQVGNLLTTLASTNAFISTATTSITTSSVSATERVAADTTYRAKIEALLGLGTGSGRYAWGVYENRVFVAEAWAGSTPDTIHYVRNLGQGQVLDPVGAVVDPWDLRPNKMYQIRDLLELNPAATEQDSAARFAVARVTFHADSGGVGATLEPGDVDDITATIARVGAIRGKA